MEKLLSYINFNKQAYPWKKGVDYRLHPELYRVGRGEQGVLICQPYKEEICSYWRFKTPQIAQESSDKIYSLFIDYLNKQDFVGADLARKYLQMGFTRARRYANYKGGKKYDQNFKLNSKGQGDPQKVLSADIFYKKWKQAEAHPLYNSMKKVWKKRYG